MLAPRTKLLFWFALVAGPSSLLPVLNPEWAGWAFLAPMTLMSLATWDAARVLGSLRGSRVEGAETTRCTQTRPSMLALGVSVGESKTKKLFLTVAMPPTLASHEDIVALPIPKDSASIHIQWAFTPLARGSHLVTEARLSAHSPLGFWNHWTRHPLKTEVKCYPNLAADRRHAAALFLNRGGLGNHSQRQVGQGREFEKLREYLPGDGYDAIHWKATAKRGQPVTKVFQIERTQEVYVMLDISRLSTRCVPTPAARWSPASDPIAQVPVITEEPMLERCLSSALVLGQAAQHQGDLFGVTVFGDRVEKFIRAGAGVGHFNACRDALYRLTSRDASPDFEELASFVRVRLRRRAMLLYLTSLDDPHIGESFLKHARLLSRQHLLMVFMVQPNGVRPLFSNENTDSVEGMYDDLGGHLRWQSLREQKRLLQQCGVPFHVLPPGELALDMIRKYSAAKNRQLL